MVFYSLFSGSSGNSILVCSNSTNILIDAGMPYKSIEESLKMIGLSAKDIHALFITHEHSDHVKGAGVMIRKGNIPLFTTFGTFMASKRYLGEVSDDKINIITEDSIYFRDICIKKFPIPHDAVDPVGYSISDGKNEISIATDIGCFTDTIFNGIKNSNIILLECNHDVEMLKFGPYPYQLKRRILSDKGHLSNDDCGRAVLNIIQKSTSLKKIILGHLSQTNNIPKLAFKTVENFIEENGFTIGKDLELSVAERSKPSNYIKI
ncbi:MAG: MBL fold metallo-hydrolase [Oscillospiraceae bacterium]|nr:MBL fold metallo-hydrolase [Oscillospiraceae bacterium]